MQINTVKQRQKEYVVNDSIFVPKDPLNADYQEIQQWIAGGGVVEPEFTLEEIKIHKIQEVKQKRDVFLNSNITVSTGEYKATQTAKSLFFNAVNGRTATQFPMPWRLADDITWVKLTKDDAYELYDAFETQETSGYEQESAFLISINSAQTVEDVNSIIIEFK